MRPAPRQPGCPARHGQTQDIGQIMPGVGQQGGGIRHQPGPELAGHEDQIDHQPDRIAPVAGVDRPVAVAAMAMAVTMRVRMAVSMIGVIVAMVGAGAVIVRGVHGFAYTPFVETAKLLLDNRLNVIT